MGAAFFAANSVLEDSFAGIEAESAAHSAEIARFNEERARHGLGRARLMRVLSDTSRHAALVDGKQKVVVMFAALLAGFSIVTAVLLTILNRNWRTSES